MAEATTYFENITLLITHYNRSSSLERLLRTFHELNCRFKEIIVSDDASKKEHLEAIHRLKEKYHFRLITSAKNKGLANNLNKGQDAVTTEYTLYVQEDFIPLSSFTEKLKQSFDIMNNTDFDITRFYAYIPYPYLKPYKYGFSEMIYKPWTGNTNKIYCYSDHPHLRRSDFFKKFGRYVEGIKSDKAEYEMCVSFIQNGGKGLFYNDFKSLFEQRNSSTEPSTVKRSNWRLSDNFFISTVRTIYRQIKYNYDIHLSGKNKRTSLINKLPKTATTSVAK